MNSGSTPHRRAFIYPAFFAGYLATQIPGDYGGPVSAKYILIACTVLGGVMTAAAMSLSPVKMESAVITLQASSSSCVMAQCSKVSATFERAASAIGVGTGLAALGITLAQSIERP